MSESRDIISENKASPRRHWPVQVNTSRAVAAAVLLVGLFAVMFFLLIPRDGANGLVADARLVDAPSGPGSPSQGVHPGRLAQDFVASDLDGSVVLLSSLRGRPVVMNFWATWCTSCLAEMPVLEQQRTDHEEDGLAIVAVNVGEGLDAARNFIEALELENFAIAMDPDLTIADAYAVRGLPHSVFIDADGVVQAEYQGQLDDATMQAYVQAAIDAVPGREGPVRPRFVTTVPREHVMEVLPDPLDPDRVLFISGRFRCDENYCAGAAIDPLAGLPGIGAVGLDSDQATQTLSVGFDADVISLEDVVALVADALREYPDPLYTRELEINFPEAAR